MERLERARSLLTSNTYTPKEAKQIGINVAQDGTRRTAYELLSFPEVAFDDIEPLNPDFSSIDAETRGQMEKEALYANYIERQKKDILALKQDEAHPIPANMDLSEIDGLTNELRAKLERARPKTLAQAARIDGMTPAALTLLLARIRREQKRRSA